MKKRLALSVVLCALLSIMTTSTASAQQQFTPHHDLRLSVGWQPLTYDYFMKYDYIGNPLLRHGAVYTAGAWGLAYTYHFKKWFEFGVLASYYGEYSAVYSNVDNSKLHPDNMHCISILPTVRFTWLNRPLVRLYSSLSVGAQIEVEEISRRYATCYVGGQLVLAGIAVGKSFFGFAEIGSGIQGFGTIGIGYRFNDKKH